MPSSGDQTNYSSLKFERFRQNWRIWRGNPPDLTELPADLAERVFSTSYGLFVDILFCPENFMRVLIRDMSLL